MESNKNTQIFDYSPLQQNMSWDSYIAQLRTDSSTNLFYKFSIAVLGVFFVILTMLITFIIGASVFSQSINGVLIGLIMLFAFWILAYGILLSHKWQLHRQYAVRLFCSTNNIKLLENFHYAPYSGVIFTHGQGRMINEAFIFSDLHKAELGNYSYVTGSGKSRTIHKNGYIKVSLPRRLPHLVLDAKSNNLFTGMTNLPVSYSTGQKLSLEGNFDQYFTLYAPDEYQSDALYIFTPDVMQMLIEYASTYDIEIIDDQLYMYNKVFFKLYDPNEIQTVRRVIATITEKLYNQSDYYADPRIGKRSVNTVAAQGKRLKQSVVPITIVSAIFLIVWSVYYTLYLRSPVVLIIMTLIYGPILLANALDIKKKNDLLKKPEKHTITQNKRPS